MGSVGESRRRQPERVGEEGLSSQLALGSTLGASTSSLKGDFSSFCFLVKWGELAILCMPPVSLSCPVTRAQVLTDGISGLLPVGLAQWGASWRLGIRRVGAAYFPLPAATHSFLGTQLTRATLTLLFPRPGVARVSGYYQLHCISTNSELVP